MTTKIALNKISVLVKEKSGALKSLSFVQDKRYVVSEAVDLTVVVQGQIGVPKGLKLSRVGNNLKINLEGSAETFEVVDYYSTKSTYYTDGSFSTPLSLSDVSLSVANTSTDGVIVWSEASQGAALGSGSSSTSMGWGGILGGLGGAAALAGGGGGGGGGAVSAPTASLVGTILMGPVVDDNDLIVRVYNIATGALETTITDVSGGGSFSVSGLTVGSSYLFVVNDGGSNVDYVDEATRAPKDLEVNYLRAIVNVTNGATFNITINPITEMVVREVLGDTVINGSGVPNSFPAGYTALQNSTTVAAANAAVIRALGLQDDIDLVRDVPVAVIEYNEVTEAVTWVTNSDEYGRLIAAISGAEIGNLNTQGPGNPRPFVDVHEVIDYLLLIETILVI